MKLGLGFVGGMVASSSTSAGAGLCRLGAGESNHLWTAVSLPCPMPFVSLAFSPAFAAGKRCLGGGGVGCCDLSLAGSSLWRGHRCHGTPHVHCHCLTSRLQWHCLHHTLLSRSWSWKEDLVPGSWCGHLGHCRKMRVGSVRAVLVGGSMGGLVGMHGRWVSVLLPVVSPVEAL